MSALPPAAPHLESHLGYWLRRVSNQVSRRFARSLQDQGLTVAEWVVLNQIQDFPDSRPAELASSIGLTRGAVSKVLDKLAARAWISRRTLAEDHRVQLISLTRSGRANLPRLAAIADRNDSHFFDCLERSEQAELRRLLAKLAATHQIREVPIE